ncbi:MAG: leucine-rich repeat domain-containing protein [Thermoguttaceae bacterium]|nr:leucine-rich repeat domain-containing protein [Thermoguttaceae bacterium]
METTGYEEIVDETLVIPDELDEAPVRRIGDESFGDVLFEFEKTQKRPRIKSLRRIRFPKCLQPIGKRAFWKCESLRSAGFPEGLEAIGNGAFRACKKFRSVTFSVGLQTIGDGAFELCSSLESVVVPKGNVRRRK